MRLFEERLRMTIAHNQDGPCIELERTLPSEVAAISPFVDRPVLLIRQCGCVSKGETDIEIALRVALANAIIHGNRRKHVDIQCWEVRTHFCEEGKLDLVEVDPLCEPMFNLEGSFFQDALQVLGAR